MRTTHSLVAAGLLALATAGACTTETISGVDARSVRVMPPEVSTVEGAEVQFSVAVVDDHDQAYDSPPVTWSSEDPSVVAIDEQGKARALKPGSTRIAARFDDVTGFAPVTVVADPETDDGGGGVIGGIVGGIIP